MLSKEVIRVKDAPDMNLIEGVRHFTFLLSEKHLEFVNGRKTKEPENIAREIEAFSGEIQQVLATHYSHIRHSSMRTANVATEMLRESRRKSKNAVNRMLPINKKDRDRVIDIARRCLRWAHDPMRPVVARAEAMTNDQVCRLACDCEALCVIQRFG